MTIKRFEEIEAWQIARQLTKEVYRESRQLPMRRDWRYCSQIQSAAASMMSNIQRKLSLMNCLRSQNWLHKKQLVFKIIWLVWKNNKKVDAELVYGPSMIT
jgi:hypothetical protein